MWPDPYRSAVALTFDLDIATPWVADDPKMVSRPGPMSMADYTPRVAIPLILDLLERQEITATFFVPGQSALDYPTTLEAIIAGGHEVAVHGFTHDPPSGMSREEEESQLTRAVAALAKFGVKPTGYRAPLYEASLHTTEILEANGFLYSSCLMNDIRPYQHPESSLIELPVSWLTDDWTQFVHGTDALLPPMSTCAQVHQLWMEEFGAIHRLGGLFNLTLHPQVIGRPSRIEMMDNLITEMKSFDGVWLSTCEAIAKQYPGPV